MLNAVGYGGQRREVESGAGGVLFTLQPAGTITGRVEDERGAAIPAFRVSASLQRDDQRTRVWQGPKDADGSEGHFVLEDVGEGTYQLDASADGKRPGLVKNILVKAGTTTDAGRIRLEAGGTIRGVVVDTRGAPVAAATVLASGGELQTTSSTQVSSGLDGFFEIRDAPFGGIEVSASHPDFASGKAEPLVVEPGQGPLTTRIVLSAGGRIEGHVRGRDGGGMVGARVQVQVLSKGVWTHGPELPVSAADGSFVAEHVPAGRVAVAAWPNADISTSHREQMTVVDGETATVEFVFRDVLVAGRVTRSGEPTPNVLVRLGYAMPWSSGAGPLNAPAPAGPRHGAAITGTDGSYEMLAGLPGETPLTIESIDHGTTFLRRTIAIPDADAFALDVALTGAPVSGTVVDRDTGDPIGSASVAAHSRKDSANDLSQIHTGSDGRFAMELPPGEYELTAQASNHARASVDVNVGGEGNTEIRIALSRGQRIEGKVVNAAGRGLAGLSIWGVSGDPEESGSAVGSADSDIDGSFTMDGLLDRSYDLSVGTELDGFALASQITAGQTDVVLTLQPGGRLLVTVKGPNGLPMADAWLMITRVGGHFIAGLGSATALDGTVDIKVPPGRIDMVVHKADAKASAEVEVPSDGLATLEVALPAH